MKVLILCENYPSESNKVALMFIHVRNLEYRKSGMELTVLNFKAKSSYMWEGVSVISYVDYKKKYCKESYDVLILHAANLKHHYKFLMRYGNKFDKKMFFFHGHEILKTGKIYPPAYSYQKRNSLLKKFLRNVYDSIKIKIWYKYFHENDKHIKLVFVSNWLRETFFETIGDELKNSYIINNSIGSFFQMSQYDYNSQKEYDFITIRSVLDGSKYCIDLLVDLAWKYPEYKFLLIGKGEYFKYNVKPDNIKWIDRHMLHDELLIYINRARCALMQTRQDTQGVMTCELAALGMPVISSDIPVCREILGFMKNVVLIPNDVSKIDLKKVYSDLCHEKYVSDKRYYKENTIHREIALVNEWS